MVLFTQVFLSCANQKQKLKSQVLLSRPGKHIIIKSKTPLTEDLKGVDTKVLSPGFSHDYLLNSALHLF